MDRSIQKRSVSGALPFPGHAYVGYIAHERII